MTSLKNQLFGFIKYQRKGVTWRQIRQEHQFIQFPTFRLIDVLGKLTKERKIKYERCCYKCIK